MKPSREQWWWRPAALKRALKANPAFDRFFHWKVAGRKNPDGVALKPAQRRAAETALWLYELDARISRKYLFGKPAHRLKAKQLASVIEFALTAHEPDPAQKKSAKHRKPVWAWIEYFDVKNEKKHVRLTRTQQDGIIAAMKFCLEHFTRE